MKKRIYYINDNVTNINFVIKSLVEIFNYSEQFAMNLIFRDLPQNPKKILIVNGDSNIIEEKFNQIKAYIKDNGENLRVRIE